MPSSAAPRPCCRPRPLVFTLTFFSYGVFHVGRKSFSTIKPILEQESFFVDGGSLSQNEMLGLLDTLFLGFYSAGLYMSGSLADRVNPRHVIAFGLLGSAFLSVLFGLGGVMNCRALPLYATIWGLNGLVQSTGWPANVSVMGAWFPSSRGTLFGLWSANISGGNILGTAVILLLLQVCGDSAGWRVSMFVIGAIMAVQIFNAAQADLGDAVLKGQIARGEFGPLREWLRERVHSVGSIHASPDELLTAIAGEPVSPRPFLEYLAAKYEELYEL